jgi:hypothetical protein
MDFQKFFNETNSRKAAKVKAAKPSKYKVLGGPWETAITGLSVALVETEDGTPVLQARMDGSGHDRFIPWITPEKATIYAACLEAYAPHKK